MLIYFLAWKSVNLKISQNELKRHSHSNIFFENGLLTTITPDLWQSNSLYEDFRKLFNRFQQTRNKGLKKHIRK